MSYTRRITTSDLSLAQSLFIRLAQQTHSLQQDDVPNRGVLQRPEHLPDRWHGVLGHRHNREAAALLSGHCRDILADAPEEGQGDPGSPR